MKNLLHSQIAGVILCAGVIFTLVWGCNDAPQNNQNQSEQGLPLLKVDSVSLLKEQKDVDSIGDIAWDLSTKNPDSALVLAKIMLQKSESAGYQKGMARAYNIIGGIYFDRADYEKALKNYLMALEIYEEEGDAARLAAVQNNLGYLYYRQSNFAMSLEFYWKAKKTIEGLPRTDENKRRLAGIQNNLGMIFDDSNDDEKAFSHYFEALKLAEEIGNKQQTAGVSNNLGRLHSKNESYSQALEYHKKSFGLYEELGDKSGMAICLENIGKVRAKKGDYESALKNLNLALKLASEIGSKHVIKDIYKDLSDVHQELGSNLACDYFRLYSEMRDSTLNEENQRQMALMQVQFDTEKKEKENEILRKDKSLQTEKIERQKAEIAKREAENNRQRLIIYATVAGVALFLTLALIVFRSYRKERKAKLLMTKQKQEIEIQKGEIESQKKEITDSIKYAKRIQDAILPRLSFFKKRLPNSFVLFKRKDVVSGDFYWMETRGDITFFAAADCTGHGVPGAMVSMVCSDALNQCIKEFGLINPGEILDKATQLVTEAFEKSKETIQDGMDISLCAINLETNELGWAGANNSLCLVRQGKLIEYKGDRQHVGWHDVTKLFKNHQIQLESGDTFYIFSDGYASQLGGVEDGILEGMEGKKFMSRKFKNLLLAIADRDMENQGDFLDQTIEEWMKPKQNLVYEQTDDILVIGVRV